MSGGKQHLMEHCTLSVLCSQYVPSKMRVPACFHPHWPKLKYGLAYFGLLFTRAGARRTEPQNCRRAFSVELRIGSVIFPTSPPQLALRAVRQAVRYSGDEAALGVSLMSLAIAEVTSLQRMVRSFSSREQSSSHCRFCRIRRLKNEHY
jgi:hypothetical protein